MIFPFDNAARAAYAECALSAYGCAKEKRPDYDAPAEMAGDLLCDLLHFIRAQGADPMQKLRMAAIHFEAEEAAGAGP